MWYSSQNLCATQKDSHAEHKQMTAIGFIVDTDEVIKASWSNFQHDSAAAFKLSERLPVPPPMSTKSLPGRQIQVSNVLLIKRIDHHPANRARGIPPESILDSKNWLHRNGEFDNLNHSEDDWEAHIESHIEVDNGIKDTETLEQRNVSASPNVPRLIGPTWRPKRKAEKLLMTANTMERRRNKGIKTT